MQKDILRLIRIFILLLFPILHFWCANPVTPEGGPKDTRPPEITLASPENHSLNFHSKDIRISFNEYINLKSSQNDIFISPPLKTAPDIRLRGKSIHIGLEDTLMAGTTYIIDFGQAVSDFTENNILADFKYVFSTGNYIDSLIITGTVVNAFDNKPQPDVYALLYTDQYDTIPFDSLPYRVNPVYITRAGKTGDFFFTNLKSAPYKVIILKDVSGDFLYNTPGEMIAFQDTLVCPWALPSRVQDSLPADSASAPDTLIPPLLTFRMFEEIDSTQQLIKSTLVNNNLLLFIFKYAVNKPDFISLDPDTLVQWFQQEINLRRDSILLWFQITLPDSLTLAVMDTDQVIDTVVISPTRKETGRKGKKTEEKTERVQISWNTRGGSYNHFRYPLEGTFSYPIREADLSKIILVTGKDSVSPAVSFIDEIHRRIRITYPWKEDQSYTILIPDSVLFTFNGLSQDTLTYSFRTVNSRNLGSLILSIDRGINTCGCIIQLEDERENVLEEQYIQSSGKVVFPFINPGKYHIKAILDTRPNRRWDTGNYLKKIQPEQVVIFPRLIEVRGNWDVEEEWRL